MSKCVQAVALGLVTYGSEAWYPGEKDFNGQPIRYKNHFDKMDRVIARCGRAAVPAYSTTPNKTILRESGFPSAHILLEDKRRRQAIRYQTLDTDHPVRKRLGGMGQIGRVSAHTHWYTPPELTGDKYRPLPSLLGPKERIEMEHWVCPGGTLRVYSDGSRLEDGRVGWGFTTSELIDGERLEGCDSLGKKAETYDAEIRGALEGLKAAVVAAGDLPLEKIEICLDNHGAATRLEHNRGGPLDHEEVSEFNEIRERCDVATEVKWVPGHYGIEGNERADQLAKEGATMPEPHRKPTLCWEKRRATEMKKEEMQKWWAKSAHESYKALEIECPAKAPKELRLPRWVLGKLIAARSGHGDFKAYHERFSHTGNRLECRCGKTKTPTHFYRCKPARRIWDRWKKRPKLPPWPEERRIRWMLSTPRGARVFQEYISKTKFFQELSTPH